MTEKHKRGRPRDPKHLKNIIDAAMALFLQNGYEQTTMNAIAKTAEVTKMTVYSYFASKDELFEYCVKVRTDDVFDFEQQESIRQLPPAEALSQIAKQFLSLIRDEQIMQVYRLLITMAAHNKTGTQHIRAKFVAKGPENLIANVAAYLQYAGQRGQLNIEDATSAASYFLAAFHDVTFFRHLIGLGLPSPEEDEQLVVHVVSRFLQAYQATQ